MKRLVVFLWTLSFIVLASGLGFAETTSQAEADAVVARWISSLANENLDGYVSCYWPEAVCEGFNPDGSVSVLAGRKAIGQRQADWFAQWDFAKMDLNYPEPTRFLDPEQGLAAYSYKLKQFSIIETFYFQKRNGELRIVLQIDSFYDK